MWKEKEHTGIMNEHRPLSWPVPQIPLHCTVLVVELVPGGGQGERGDFFSPVHGAAEGRNSPLAALKRICWKDTCYIAGVEG